MPCPLNASDVRDALASLPSEFNTFDFIEVCPQSGGRRDGTGCAEVRDGRGRGVCGKAVASFTPEHPKFLTKLAGKDSPAKWRQGEQTSSPSPGAAGWPAAQQRDQVQSRDAIGSALNPGHWDAVDWLASAKFAEIKAVYDKACGPGAVYFRVVDKAVKAISLHPSARCYLGHRTFTKDMRYVLKKTMAVPDVEELRLRHADVTSWLLDAGQRKPEEQAVILWLSRALKNCLWLPDLGPDWVLLNQEWRFIGDDGKGRKSDVLAVHIPSGQLGIVEAKSCVAELRGAKRQVREYARHWQRDAAELAPFFTSQLRAMGRLYGNDAAAEATVADTPAALFVAAPGPAGLRVYPA